VLARVRGAALGPPPDGVRFRNPGARSQLNLYPAWAGAAGISKSKPGGLSISDRLRALPRSALPLQRPVQVHWNAHQVPFIEAETDHDLAVALGLVHVHLRWTQMEFMRHVAQGRISELAGPFGLGLDRMLRTVDLTRAVPKIAASMPGETRDWADAFLRGVNHAIAHLPAEPPEFRLLGLRRVPWGLSDLLSLGRLAAFDVTWLVWLALLPAQRAGVAQLWRMLFGREAMFDVAGDSTTAGMLPRLRAALTRFARPGSNSWAVGPSRGAGGAAWIASDTHLGAMLPNLWLLAGCRSPSFHAAGLMVPGLPVIAVGRNPWIAWGGTNLHAASSDLFDVAELPAREIRTRRERIRVRFLGTREITVRETQLGPILSDLRPFRRAGTACALRWIGHQPSDELSALLGVNRARGWEEFRTALNGLAVPGQNMVYADAAGHVGKVLAVHLPARPPAPPRGPVLPRSEAVHWHRTVRSRDLPAQFDPAEGFVASANDKPTNTDVLVGYFFSSSQRVNRLRAVLSEASGIGFDALARLQQDTLAPAGLPVRDRLLPLLRDLGGPAARSLSDALDGWDGAYEADSSAPLVFELLLYHLGIALHGRPMMRLYSSSWSARTLLFEELLKLSPARLSKPVRYAVPRAAAGLRRFRTWGAMHRLEPRHVLAALPVLGRRFRFGEWAASGGSDTLMKTANALTSRRHNAALASTARHISDLSDVDANWFVLLGGQDGWPGSTTLVDQVELWRAGRYMQIPLREETVRAQFPLHVELRP